MAKAQKGKTSASKAAVKGKTLRQTVTFEASTHEVYEMLIDSKKHSAFTGGKAVISRKVGGAFSAFDGGLHGKNLELKADKKIMQAWRSDEANWPETTFSRATFTLKKLGKNRTELSFHQSGIPAACYADIKSGWHEYYWIPMKIAIAEAMISEKKSAKKN